MLSQKIHYNSLYFVFAGKIEVEVLAASTEEAVIDQFYAEICSDEELIYQIENEQGSSAE